MRRDACRKERAKSRWTGGEGEDRSVGGWTVSWWIRGKKDSARMMCRTGESGGGECGTATPYHKGQPHDVNKNRIIYYIFM